MMSDFALSMMTITSIGGSKLLFLAVTKLNFVTRPDGWIDKQILQVLHQSVFLFNQVTNPCQNVDKNYCQRSSSQSLTIPLCSKLSKCQKHHEGLHPTVLSSLLSYLVTVIAIAHSLELKLTKVALQ